MRRSYCLLIFIFISSMAYAGKAKNPSYIYASFFYSPDIIHAPTTINFINWSSAINGTIVTESWDWGDGIFSIPSSVGQTVPHTYVAAGNYSVKLIVTDNSGGRDSVTKIVSVFPANSIVVADFTYSPLLFIQMHLHNLQMHQLLPLIQLVLLCGPLVAQ